MAQLSAGPTYQSKLTSEKLERQTKRELDLARTAKRSRCSPDGCRRRATHGTRDLSEAGTAHAVDGVREVGVIEEIEEVRAERQARPISPDREILERGEIRGGPHKHRGFVPS